MAQISKAHINYIVSHFPCLSDVTIEDWNTEGISLASLSSSVFHEGQFLEFAVLVLDGTIRMYKISGSGREITHYRINGGECCPLMMSSILGETVYEA